MDKEMKISENTEVKLDLKTIGIIVGFTISLASMYFALKSDIAIAMEKPEPKISQVEFEYKDKLVRATIDQTQSDVEKIKEDISAIKTQLEKMDERLYEISKQR